MTEPEEPGRCANPEWYTLAVCVFFIVAFCLWAAFTYATWNWW